MDRTLLYQLLCGIALILVVVIAFGSGNPLMAELRERNERMEQPTISGVEFAGPFAYVDIVDQTYGVDSGSHLHRMSAIVEQFEALYPEFEVTDTRAYPRNLFTVEGWLLEFRERPSIE